MSRADLKSDVAARIARVAAAVAKASGNLEAQALAEISEALRAAKIRPASADAVEALTMAAAMFAVDQPAREQWWFTAAFDFLVGLGANAKVARAVRAAVKG
jgi:hypothetical protein